MKENEQKNVDKFKIQAIKNLLSNNVEIKVIANSFEVTQKYVKQIQKEMKEKK